MDMMFESLKKTLRVKFRLNGIPLEKAVPIGWTLLRYLRDGLGYTGTKCGCEVGECGSCTILFNSDAMNACLILAPQIDGADIWTIEGVADVGNGVERLHPLQKVYLKYDAVHCGFCTPGMVMSTIALFLKKRKLDDSDIKQALAGNLCRCTGYVQIIEAVRQAAGSISEKELEKFKYIE